MEEDLFYCKCGARVIDKVNHFKTNKHIRYIMCYHPDFYKNHKQQLEGKTYKTYTCKCGGKYTIFTWTSHSNTKKHMKYLRKIKT